MDKKSREQQQGKSQQQGAGQDTTRQQQQFDASEQTGFAAQIRERMEVFGADGARIGRLDHVEGDRIRFAAADLEPLSRPADAHEAWLPLAKVRSVEGDRVRLTINASEFPRTTARN